MCPDCTAEDCYLLQQWQQCRIKPLGVDAVDGNVIPGVANDQYRFYPDGTLQKHDSNKTVQVDSTCNQIITLPACSNYLSIPELII